MSVCPTCGKAELTEWPHRHGGPDVSEPLTAEDRLREAIAGERRDWHRVEVSSHDIEVVLATLDAARPSGEDAERRLRAIRQRVANATEARNEDHTLYDGHDCWRCAMVDREVLLATLDAARPSGLDVERLAKAWNNLTQPGQYAFGYNGVSMHVWRAVAAEYEELARQVGNPSQGTADAQQREGETA